jgi:sugar lactone lactonase YvrE
MKNFLINAMFCLCSMTIHHTCFAQWSNGQAAYGVVGTGGSFTAVGSLTASGIAIDETNNKLYVSDYCNHVVYRYALTAGNLASSPVIEATFGTVASSGTTQTLLKRPSGLVIDNTGRLFIADGGNNRIVYINAAYNKTNRPAFDGVLGQVNFTNGSANRGAGVSANNSFNFSVSSPSSLFSCQSTSNAGYMAITSDNILFVADPGNNRIMRFNNPSSSTIANAVIGQLTVAASVAATTISNFKTPMGIALNGNSLYIADMNNSRIVRYDNATTLSTGTNNASAVYGQTSFTSASGGRSATTFDLPIGIAVGSDNTLYINDSNNGRTVYINNANTKNGGTGTAVSFNGVIGQANLTAYAGSASATTMWAGVTGLAVSSTSKLFIGNSGYGRMLQFNATPLPVDFVDFKAKKINGQTNLTWIVSFEYNNEKFEIETSADGIHFEKSKEVLSKGNTNSLRNYETTISSQNNSQYFRIKQVDLDGVFTYSKVISSDEKTVTSVSIYPNPSTEGVIYYTLNTITENTTINILSVNGNTISTTNVSSHTGEIDTHQLMNGMYFLQVITGNTTVMERFIKK